jgi:hypothetical protein
MNLRYFANKPIRSSKVATPARREVDIRSTSFRSRARNHRPVQRNVEGTVVENIGIWFLVLVLFGPLFIIPAIWAVHQWFTKPVLVPRLKSRFATLPSGLPLAMSTALVLGILLVSYLPGRITYNALCDAHATPRIIERVNVEGLFLDKPYGLYSADEHFYEQGFAFVEGPNSPGKHTSIRYTLGADHKVRQEEVEELLSRFGMREEYSNMPWGVRMTKKIVYELKSNRVLAEAALVYYDGGPFSLFFSGHGFSSCSDRDEDQGTGHFVTYDNLEAIVLRSLDFSERADWFGKTGLSAETERFVPDYVRGQLGQKRFEPGALKASDLSYVGSFTEGDWLVHYWRLNDKDEYAYLIYKGKWFTSGWRDRKPPAKATH